MMRREIGASSAGFRRATIEGLKTHTHSFSKGTSRVNSSIHFFSAVIWNSKPLRRPFISFSIRSYSRFLSFSSSSRRVLSSSSRSPWMRCFLLLHFLLACSISVCFWRMRRVSSRSSSPSSSSSSSSTCASPGRAFRRAGRATGTAPAPSEARTPTKAPRDRPRQRTWRSRIRCPPSSSLPLHAASPTLQETEEPSMRPSVTCWWPSWTAVKALLPGAWVMTYCARSPVPRLSIVQVPARCTAPAPARGPPSSSESGSGKPSMGPRLNCSRNSSFSERGRFLRGLGCCSPPSSCTGSFSSSMSKSKASLPPTLPGSSARGATSAGGGGARASPVSDSSSLASSSSESLKCRGLGSGRLHSPGWYPQRKRRGSRCAWKPSEDAAFAKRTGSVSGGASQTVRTAGSQTWRPSLSRAELAR
mmetsp:Transcript_34057/g.106235  ORF Transcript_34057/g.106235 Transcript_34057/m.106235 type:complete len:418 (+) Transcript_34057:2356-3609(+)